MTTVAEVLAVAVATLERAGIDTARTDARRILTHVLGVGPERFTLMADDSVPGHRVGTFLSMIDLRATFVPVSHIVGYRDFWKHRFIVTPDVLDPRPETEVLVEQALTQPFARLLDLGTGSGCILLSLLAERPGASGLGTDLSEPALAVARDNAAQLDLTARASFATGDWWNAVSGRFDLIVSNPPYIAADEMAGLPPDVRNWEPHLALTPGGDGLDAYRRIAAGARAHLTPGGRLLVEIGPSQGAAVMALFAAAGLSTPSITQDLDHRDRIVTATAP